MTDQPQTPPEQPQAQQPEQGGLVPTLLQITVVQATIDVDDIPNGKVVSFLSLNGIRIAIPMSSQAAGELVKKLGSGSGLVIAKGKLPPNLQRQ